MVMSLVLGVWEALSLKSGCNLYSSKFRFCVLTVRKAHENLHNSSLSSATSGGGGGSFSYSFSSSSSSPSSKGGVGSVSPSMYFRERDPPAVDIDLFLATALPKLLLASLIIFLNGLAILGLARSSRALSSPRGHTSSVRPGFLFLPASTQGLLHSLFAAYLALGLLTFYSQISLSSFVLLEWRLVEEQGTECLLVNCAILALSIAITLHLLSLAVDRALAQRLSYPKYSKVARGTVGLWLLAIWLPSCILGALPLSGWRNPFNFCIFLHQFNDDYLRFVGGFHFAILLSIPLLYLHLRCTISQRTHPLPPQPTLYRWERKLRRSHLILTASALILNALCWSPFHAYLLLACASCPFSSLSSFGSGLLHEYLFILALLPAIALPTLFSIRTSLLANCAHNLRTQLSSAGSGDNNPLSSHSTSSTTTRSTKLFSIHDYPTGRTSSNKTNTTTASSSIYRDTLTGRGSKSHLFLPRYLPTTDVNNKSTHIPATRYVKKTTTTTASTRRSGTGAGSGGWSVGVGYGGGGRSTAVMGGVPNPSFERESPSTQETDEWMTETVVVVPPKPVVIRVGGGGQEEEDLEEDDPYYSQILSHTLPRKATS